MAEIANLNRRDFLRIGGSGLVGLAAWPAIAASAAREAEAPQGYPVMDIGPLSGLAPGAAIRFHYPDADSPAVMLRLAEPAIDGIGPGRAVVAFSTLCTHKGCPVDFHAERKLLICPCHWSSFDASKAGSVVIGQASQPLPRIRLTIDGDRIRAVGVEGLIYGRHTNII